MAKRGATGYHVGMMQLLKAQVRNGRLVLDDPSTDLPEGARVRLTIVDDTGEPADDELEPEERARLIQAIEDAEGDIARGDYGVDGFELIAQLRAKREAASRQAS